MSVPCAKFETRNRPYPARNLKAYTVIMCGTIRLKELCLELRELEEQGDFDWMMLGYAEDKKNTLRLVETGVLPVSSVASQ